MAPRTLRPWRFQLRGWQFDVMKPWDWPEACVRIYRARKRGWRVPMNVIPAWMYNASTDLWDWGFFNPFVRARDLRRSNLEFKATGQTIPLKRA